MDRAALTDLTNKTRRELRSGFINARIAGDKAELVRLTALARELDAQTRRAALGALAEAAAAVQAIIARIAKPERVVADPESDTSGEVEPIDAHPGDETASDDQFGDDTTGRSKDGDIASDDADHDDSANDESDLVNPAPDDAEPLAWGRVTARKHGAEFNAKVREIAERMECDPNYLMAVMAFETGETFSPKIRNAAGSGATGLIQFMPATARRLGTTTAKLASMRALDQLDYVEKYFRTATGRQMRSLSDIYMAVLWPAAVGRAESHVLFRKPSRAYVQNRGLDGNRDGVITKAEASAKVHAKLVKGVKAERLG